MSLPSNDSSPCFLSRPILPLWVMTDTRPRICIVALGNMPLVVWKGQLLILRTPDLNLGHPPQSWQVRQLHQLYDRRHSVALLGVAHSRSEVLPRDDRDIPGKYLALISNHSAEQSARESRSTRLDPLQHKRITSPWNRRQMHFASGLYFLIGAPVSICVGTTILDSRY